jgi:uncharacterized protein (DUF305 family)
MKSTKIRVLASSCAIFVASVTLTGCTVNLGWPFMGNGNMMGNSQDANFSGADIMFAQMMIPHHQQAVNMGTLAETRAMSAEVKALAAKIKAEQSPEIAQMKGWLKIANAPLTMGHDMGMGGMLSDSQMKALENSQGADFDQLFLQGMVAHHQGAIHMAQMVVDSTNPEAKALGKAIIDSQTKQIAYMETLLAK